MKAGLTYGDIIGSSEGDLDAAVGQEKGARCCSA